MGGTVCGRTGRHTYTEWDPFYTKDGGPHPALNPFNLPQNRRCRRNYSKNMCPRSLEILNRTVMIGNHPDRTDAEVDALIAKIKAAATNVVSA